MKKIVETVRLRNKRISESFCGGDCRISEGISVGMVSGHYAASAIMEHFDNPQMACVAYQKSTENLKSYMQRQWSLVGGMAGTFKEME